MKKLKNGYHFVNINHTEKFQNTDFHMPPHKSLGLWFSKFWWKQNISIGHYEKIEKWPPFCKYQSYRKNSNYQPPPKVLVSGFLSVDINKISVSVIMKKIKNGHHFININHMEKFQITNPRSPTKFRSPVYPTSHPCVVLHFLIFLWIVASL